MSLSGGYADSQELGAIPGLVHWDPTRSFNPIHDDALYLQPVSLVYPSWITNSVTPYQLILWYSLSRVIHAPGWLRAASDGNLYGTTAADGFFGPGGLGTVFRMTPSGVITTIHSFDTGGGDIDPEGDLIRGSDGNFYGTAYAGGASLFGTLFQMTTNGVVTRPQLVQCSQRGLFVLSVDGPSHFQLRNTGLLDIIVLCP